MLQSADSAFHIVGGLFVVFLFVFCYLALASLSLSLSLQYLV
jgi:hypothetical protein